MQQQALLNFYYSTFATDIGLLSGGNFAATRVSDDEPAIIYDLNGHPLFADYHIVDGFGTVVGTVRSSARDTDMPLIDSIQIGDPWYDEKAARDKALTAAAALNLKAVGSSKLVCYGYPRLGILVTGTTDGGGTNLLYDAGSGELVRQWDDPAPAAKGEAGIAAKAAVKPHLDPTAADIEGVPFYSVLGARSEGGEPVSAATKQWNEIRAAFASTHLQPAARQQASGLVAPVAAPAALRLEQLQVDALQGGVPRIAVPRIAVPPIEGPQVEALQADVPRVAELAAPRVAVRGSIMPAQLVKQMAEVYCAVAAAEMILAFVGIDQTQAAIATAMHTSADGTTNPNFVKGIAALSNGMLTAQYQDNPDFGHFVDIVEGMLPAKSGIPGHARLLRGWREYIVFDAHGKIISKQQFLVINDPYPVSSGQLVMENVIKPIDGFYTNAISVGLAQPAVV